MRIKRRLSLQQYAREGKQSVRDTPDSTSVRVAASSQGSVARAALGVELRGGARQMVDGVAQSNARRVLHDDDVRLASFGDRRDTPGNGPLGLTKECKFGVLDPTADIRSHGNIPSWVNTGVSSGRHLPWPIEAIGQAPLPAFSKQASFGALR
jgi:hypothetical protein